MTDNEKTLWRDQRYSLAIDSVGHARACLQDHRGDLALKALDVAEHQISKIKDMDQEATA